MYLWFKLLEVGLWEDCKTELPEEYRGNGDSAPDIDTTTSIDSDSAGGSARRGDSQSQQLERANTIMEKVSDNINIANQTARYENKRSHLYSNHQLLVNEKKELKTDIQDLKREKKEEGGKIDDLTEKLFDAEDRKDERRTNYYKKRLSDIETAIAEIDKEISGKETLIDGLAARIQSKDKAIRDLESQISTMTTTQRSGSARKAVGPEAAAEETSLEDPRRKRCRLDFDDDESSSDESLSPDATRKAQRKRRQLDVGDDDSSSDESLSLLG